VSVSSRTTHSSLTHYDDLARRVATHGPEAVELELRRFVADARSRCVSPLLTSILTDKREPTVVRQRAFGRILTELANARPCRSPDHGEVSDAV
jgi:hypothetical protein